MALPSVEPQHPLEAARKLLKKGIAVPYCLPLPTEDTNWKVSFQKPDDITLVGSWPNKVSVKAKDGLKYGVDVAVQMPDVRIRHGSKASSDSPVVSLPRKGLPECQVLPEKGVLSR